MGYNVAVLGASGYAGGELLRLIADHPALDLAYAGAHTKAGAALADVHPQLPGGDLELGPIDAASVPRVDLAFLALPHGASWQVGIELAERGVRVADLGSDFRMDTPERYAEAYGAPHPRPDQLGEWAYGLPELFGAEIAGAARVAVPGCYPSSAVLGLAPLVAGGVVEPTGIVVNSLSGATGAGRGVKADLTFGAVAEGVKAYGVTTHRHRPEMERALAAATGVEPQVVFTPHLVPMQRGLLSTCSARLAAGADPGNVDAALRNAYAASPFVEVRDDPPVSRWAVGSNMCLLASRVDERSGTAIVVSVLDNLMKGAAGQAVQCANLMLGIPETAGLPRAGILP